MREGGKVGSFQSDRGNFPSSGSEKVSFAFEEGKFPGVCCRLYKRVSDGNKLHSLHRTMGLGLC